MTLAEGEGVKPVEVRSPISMVRSEISPRQRPRIHPAVEPPVCPLCAKLELSFFDPTCPSCKEILEGAGTSVPQIFAILRQWTSHTQCSLEKLVKEILKRGAHVNDRDGLTDMTLLHYAAKSGSPGVGDVNTAINVVKFLLQEGADVYIRCRWTNMTALHYATYFDVAAVMKILLEETDAIDIDSRCSEFDNGTSLHIAATNISTEPVKILLDNGANPLALDRQGRSPLDCVPDPGQFEPGSALGRQAAEVRAMLIDAQPQSSSNQTLAYDAVPSKVTLSSLGLSIGDKVVVGGVKTGTLQFCGPTEFAPGLWAGIELDEPAGKNDGSVAGVPYFTCPAMHGIFAPVTKIGRPGSASPQKSPNSSKAALTHAKLDTSHVTAKVDTGLNRSHSSPGEGSDHLEVGDRVMVAGQRRGVVQYSGNTDFAPGWWYGVELDRPVGKNDGTVGGKRYFTCKPKHGVFAPPSRVTKLSDLEDSGDFLDLSACGDHQRRHSVGSTGSSQPSLTSTPKSRSSRPKSSGSPGRMSRALPMTQPNSEFCLQEGMTVFCNNELGMLRYIGPVEFAEGVWLGVELRTPQGKNDGSVQGHRYFTCKPNYGLIVRPSKITVRGINGAKLLGDTSPVKQNVKVY